MTTPDEAAAGRAQSEPAMSLLATQKIPVIMPAYNEEKEIADTIESARAHLEMISI